MGTELSPADRAKYAAARQAVDFIEDGMRVGLGTGSTAEWMVRCLAKRLRDTGMKIRGVPTSNRTAELAASLGIEVITLDQAGWLDLTIDGADEFDADLNLIKGAGGAHLQEKVVATASDRMVVITDPSKDVATLGAFALPVEVLQFGWQATSKLVERVLADMDVDARVVVRREAQSVPFVTDEGNFILDLGLSRIGNAPELSIALNQIAGVVENGLFLNICDTVVIGHEDGRFEVRGVGGKALDAGQIDLAESKIL